MDACSPIDLLFGGMEKLGPGGNVHTLHALCLLPQRQFRLIVDAGCGTGRQTLALAGELRTMIHAVDSHRAFLDDLLRRAKLMGFDGFVQTHCMDMIDIPEIFRQIDLLWSEGAAYNIGFSTALRTWALGMSPGGFAAVSELSWLRDEVSDPVKEFFNSCYPAMQSVQQNIRLAEDSGYKVLAIYTLPSEAWVDGYYDILGPRARSLAGHPDTSVRNFAAETVREIEIFESSEDSYGYVFYLLQRP